MSAGTWQLPSTNTESLSADLINLGTWLDRQAFARLLGHITKVYSEHSRLREIIDNLDLTSDGIFMPSTVKVKEVISPAEICALPNVNIDSKMSALMDLSYRHFCTGGIAKYYRTLNEIERFLYQSLRPNTAINVGMLNSPSHYGLACFIYADICRSVSLGYATAFPYVFQPQSTHILTGTEVFHQPVLHSRPSADYIYSILMDVPTSS